MVGNQGAQMTQTPHDNIAEDLHDAYPELEAVLAAASGPVYLVGGAVRDIFLGRGRSANLDLVVESDAAGLAGRLGEDVLEHERFGTATFRLGELEVDVAVARTEAYPEPGALPDVTPGARIEADLTRRDFTINSMAIPLDEPRLVDPCGGRADLESGVLRILHSGSFVDDPTRALRAARYASRLGFTLEAGTEELLRATDLETVSADRRDAELLRLAAEASAPEGFELLAGWGLVELRPGGVELASSVIELLAGPPWAGFAPTAPTVLRAALGAAPTGEGSGAETALTEEQPGSPSEAVAVASRHEPEELALARALGSEWLDEYLAEWRQVALDIDGADLIDAGVPEGPAVGRGLAEALRKKLDGEIRDRDGELAAALAAAREA